MHRTKDYGSHQWVKRMGVTIGLESTLRPRGRQQTEGSTNICVSSPPNNSTMPMEPNR